MGVKKALQTHAKQTTISLWIPKSKGGIEVLRRLQALAAQKGRSVNYLVVEAIVQYLREEEKSVKANVHPEIPAAEIERLEGVVLFKHPRLREEIEEARADIAAGRIRDVDELIAQAQRELNS